jgi:hypothetical protein
MITKIYCADDAQQALNENLEGMLTGKRKLDLAKEVDNNIGKHIALVKFELADKIRMGDKTALKFFASQNKQLKSA